MALRLRKQVIIYHPERVKMRPSDGPAVEELAKQEKIREQELARKRMAQYQTPVEDVKPWTVSESLKFNSRADQPLRLKRRLLVDPEAVDGLEELQKANENRRVARVQLNLEQANDAKKKAQPIVDALTATTQTLDNSINTMANNIQGNLAALAAPALQQGKLRLWLLSTMPVLLSWDE